MIDDSMAVGLPWPGLCLGFNYFVSIVLPKLGIDFLGRIDSVGSW